jgi:hypothetical protein
MNPGDHDETKPETPNRSLATLENAVDPAEPAAGEVMKELALSGGIQALWAVVLPMIGVRSSRAGEFPGVFQVEQGPSPHEALVHVDIPHAPYEVDKSPAMTRVISLSVKLAHDFRRLGDRYYCIDCEIPGEETRH